MFRRRLPIGLLALISLGASQVDAGDGVWRPDVRGAWQAALDEGKPLLLYIGMDACHHCQRMERDTLSDETVVRFVAEGFVAATIDAEAEPELVEQLGVTAFPSTIVISFETGKMLRITGYLSPDEFRDRVARAVRQLDRRGDR